MDSSFLITVGNNLPQLYELQAPVFLAGAQLLVGTFRRSIGANMFLPLRHEERTAAGVFIHFFESKVRGFPNVLTVFQGFPMQVILLTFSPEKRKFAYVLYDPKLRIQNPIPWEPCV